MVYLVVHRTEHVQIFIVFQESLPEIEIDRVSGVDVFEVISLLNQLLRVCQSPGCLNTDRTRTRTHSMWKLTLHELHNLLM